MLWRSPWRAVDGVPVIRAVGELEIATVPEMRAVVDEVTERRPRALVFDFRQIAYMDSSGLGILVSAKKRLGTDRGEVVLITAQPAVLKALSLSGLDQIIRIYPTVEELSTRSRVAAANPPPWPLRPRPPNGSVANSPSAVRMSCSIRDLRLIQALRALARKGDPLFKRPQRFGQRELPGFQAATTVFQPRQRRLEVEDFRFGGHRVSSSLRSTASTRVESVPS